MDYGFCIMLYFDFLYADDPQSEVHGLLSESVSYQNWVKPGIF